MALELTARQRHDVDNWLKKLHRQFGHRSNRRLEEMLQRRGAHPTTLFLVKHFKCQACEGSQAPLKRNVVASYDARPGEVLEIDGTQRRHLITSATCRGRIMVDVGSRCVMVRVFEETQQSPTSNNSTGECWDALIDGWMPERRRPKLVRLDPVGAYVSHPMVQVIAGLNLDVQVTPREAPWHLCVLGIVQQLVKRSASLYAIG